MLFLSAQQRDVIAARPGLSHALAHLSLPAWVPQRVVARALGHSPEGVERALTHLGGRPYCWATEFENVHALWRYDEPPLVVDGAQHECSEAYFHSQKPQPFDAEEWAGRRDDVMRTALRAKLRADPGLATLLRTTRGVPLLALKQDMYWGKNITNPSEGRAMLGHRLGRC